MQRIVEKHARDLDYELVDRYATDGALGAVALDPVAVRVRLGRVAGFAHERIVLRHPAIVVEPEDAARVIAEVLLTVQSWLGLLVFVTALLVNWLYWRHQAAHFALGCANPATVVSLNPPLLAVYTDLTTGERAYPVIKILRDSGIPSSVGDKFATVSLYQGSTEAERWEDFDSVQEPSHLIALNEGGTQ